MKNDYIFIVDKNLYEFVTKTMYFNEAKKEREIFELWYQGENNTTIAKITGYVEGTIRNRKKEIIEKYNNLLDRCKVSFF